MDTVELVYRHPNPRVMASGPRILDYTPTGKEQEFYDPQERQITVGDNPPVTAIVYTVPSMYARQLLSAQPDRYFLLTPDKLVVPIFSQNGLRRENTIVRSILSKWKDAAVGPPPVTEAASKPEPSKDDGLPPPGHPQGHPLRPMILPEGATKGPLLEEEKPATEMPAAPKNPLARPPVGEE